MSHTGARVGHCSSSWLMDSLCSGSSVFQDSSQLVCAFTWLYCYYIDIYPPDVNIPIFVVLYVGYKVVYRTKFWKPTEMDFVTVSFNVIFIFLLPLVDSFNSRAFRHQKRPKYQNALRRISENVLLTLSSKHESVIMTSASYVILDTNACKCSHVMSIIVLRVASELEVGETDPIISGTCPASKRDTFSAVFCGWRSSVYQHQAVRLRKVDVGDNSPEEIGDWGGSLMEVRKSLRCRWKTTWSSRLRLVKLLDWRERRRKVVGSRMLWYHPVDCLLFFRCPTAKGCWCHLHSHCRPTAVLGLHWYHTLAVFLTPWRR